MGAFFSAIFASSTGWVYLFIVTVVYVIAPFDDNPPAVQAVKAFVCLLLSLGITFAIVSGAWEAFMFTWGVFYTVFLCCSSWDLAKAVGIGAFIGWWVTKD